VPSTLKIGKRRSSLGFYDFLGSSYQGEGLRPMVMIRRDILAWIL
jgi:hypothetical protein